ncbi:MAG: DUF2267 domain-containing protein [bacterium]
MKFEEYIDTVMQEANINDEEALQAVHATLSTLGERLKKSERDKLASEMPKAFKPFLYEHANADYFEIEDFFTRVKSRTGTSYSQAVDRAQAVGKVLKKGIHPGQVNHLLEVLPRNYSRLFEK